MGGLVAGVDEVGRAPLAGPVLAAAVVLPADAETDPRLAGIDDSKKLSEPVRDRLALAIRSLARVGLGAASAPEIDRANIHQATLYAMARAVAALRTPVDAVVVDGRHTPAVPCRSFAVVGGDGRCLSVAAASIVAKVARDRLMRRLDARHPGYGWARNVGYPTDDHTWGLLRLGPTRHHRRSFAPLPQLMADPGFGLTFRSPAVVPLGTPDALRLIRLRQDLCAVADPAGHHLGSLKAVRQKWQFRAVGYDGAGGLVEGGGPLAPWHGRPVAAPEPAALMALFTLS